MNNLEQIKLVRKNLFASDDVCAVYKRGKYIRRI